MASVSYKQARQGEPIRQQGRYGIRAIGLVHKPLAEIADVRKALGFPGAEPFPPAMLKPSDEQTVVAVAAVVQAIERAGLQDEDFSQWAVVAAPRFLGRLAASEIIFRFEGPKKGSKVSPLFVPHRSLHAISGTISQVFNIKGPNFGVGGGHNAAVEGLLNAISLLDDHQLPGLWMVMSQCHPEPEPDSQAINTVPVICHAIALGFAPVAEEWQGLRLSLAEGEEGTAFVCRPFPDGGKATPGRKAVASAFPAFDRLYEFLEKGSTCSSFGTWVWPLPWGHELRLSDEQ